MNFANDGEIPGTSQNTVERGERVLLKDFIPVPVFNERTLERMKKMEGRRRRGVVVYYCQHCNYATGRKVCLVNHSRTHSGERPFECCVCDDQFSQKANLSKHLLRKHMGVKPYVCSQCSYKSAQKGNLDRHILTHSGAKPFTCDYCPFKTALKSNLTRHLLKVCKHAPRPFLPL